jgi:Mg2+-importing ATPase
VSDSQFWNAPSASVVGELGTSTTGLASAEAEHRLHVHGPNDAAATPRQSAWARLRRRFANPLVIILLSASVLSAIAGDIASLIIISTIVGLSVLLDMIQELRAQNAVEALRAKIAVRARTMRDGRETVIPVSELVPGDIVQLEAGDLVPADGRLLASQDFFVNQALLTGEPYPVEKQALDPSEPVADVIAATNAALAGSSVVSGTATFLICRTGRMTALGALAQTLAIKAPPTAFEMGLRRFSELILRITVLLVLVVLTESLMFHRAWLESLMFAVALAVGLTPELLPMIVTVTLARGAVRLARERVIVKRLAAIHNLGAMDVLCTDKTGTLTESRITLTRHMGVHGEESQRVFELAYLNSYFETGLKSPLDAAILEHEHGDASAWRKLDEVPFDFVRRRVSVLLDHDGRRLLIAKGAPEDILRLSTRVEGAGGAPEPMTPQTRMALGARFEQLGDEGFRALGIASRVLSPDRVTIAREDEGDLVFTGFAVFLDPPKSSAAHALAALSESGVAVKVLTGDNERVATHVCAELGMPNVDVMTGDELTVMTDEALLARLPRTTLFARVTPQQKLRVLLALKRMGQTVGFLGDGINDAPALHAADVGISVDSAADVAKAAGEIILLDKDLNVLHEGVIEGRRTVVNVDKYILMASSANFGNIVSMALAGAFLPFLPLLPIQVLLTNLLYDFAQTGLPFDLVDREAVRRPVHWDIRLVERFMLAMGPISTVFDLVTFGVLILGFQAGVPLFRTGWFVESLVTQILMIFAVRTRRRLFRSRPHPFVAALALGTSGLTLMLPFLPIGPWFGFVVPPLLYFVFLPFAVVAFLVMIEAVKRRFYAHMIA